MEKTIDPVCGMEVDIQTATEKAQYQGRIYYFCSEDCRASFESDPERYLTPPTETHQNNPQYAKDKPSATDEPCE